MNYQPTPSIYDFLTSFDLAIIAFFLMAFLLLPKLFSGQKDHNETKEYMLMGRGLTLPLFVATLTSTWYGGILGVTQIAYTQGIYSFVTQGLFWYVAYFLFAIFLAKKIRRHEVMSLPELIGRQFGSKARRFCAVLLFFHALPITYAISVGLVLELTLGIDFLYAEILGVAIVSIYTALGGFRGVVITDALQCALMFVAVIMVVVAGFFQVGDLAFLKATLPAHYFSMSGDHRLSSAVIWLLIACTTTFIHPVFYQRCLAAKSDRVAVQGIFLAMGLWLLFDVCTCLGGMYARALLPKADSATAYLMLAMNILPAGLRGIFMTGVLATVLSTLDSFMLVCGTSISYDLLGKKSLSKHAHQIAIMACGALVIAISTIFRRDFEAIWLLMGGAFSTSILVSVLAAMLSKQKFGTINFILPATGSLAAFLLSTYLTTNKTINIEPFYIAHTTGFILFTVVLYTQTQRNTKVANFADG
jgi:solute:Na+ symporter, SSS family